MVKEYKKELKISISAVSLPSITLHDDELSLSFVNWQNRTVRIEFESVLAFKCTDPEYDELLEDDKAYRIFESDWLKELLIQKKIRNGGVYHHYQFCFRGSSVIEVVCKKISQNTIG